MVAAAAIPHEGVPLGIVTVSVGTSSTVPTGQGAAEALLGLADAALDQAKRDGRNRVVSA